MAVRWVDPPIERQAVPGACPHGDRIACPPQSPSRGLTTPGDHEPIGAARAVKTTKRDRAMKDLDKLLASGKPFVLIVTGESGEIASVALLAKLQGLLSSQGNTALDLDLLESSDAVTPLPIAA